MDESLQFPVNNNLQSNHSQFIPKFNLPYSIPYGLKLPQNNQNGKFGQTIGNHLEEMSFQEISGQNSAHSFNATAAAAAIAFYGRFIQPNLISHENYSKETHNSPQFHPNFNYFQQPIQQHHQLGQSFNFSEHYQHNHSPLKINNDSSSHDLSLNIGKSQISSSPNYLAKSNEQLNLSNFTSKNLNQK